MTGRFANIIVDISHEKVDRPFQYRIPEALMGQLEVGMAVMIPFGLGNKRIKGYVMEITDRAEYDEHKLKAVDSIVKDGVSAQSDSMKLAWWIRENYGSTMIAALKTVLPVKKKLKQVVRQPALPQPLVTGKLNVTGQTIQALEKAGLIEVQAEGTYRNVLPENIAVLNSWQKKQLSESQQAIVDSILHDFRADVRRTYLIHGVTGSGKTEVYMELIEQMMVEGRQAIMLIPEIALTYQTLMRFYRRFGDRVSVMNSRLSAGERSDQYERAARGGIDIMIGPRSALFTPFERLGLVIIDEEHENSYKSESMPKYHAREVAGELCRMKNAQAFYTEGTACRRAAAPCLCGGFAQRAQERKPLDF